MNRHIYLVVLLVHCATTALLVADETAAPQSVTDWVVTEKGRTPVEQTALKHIWKSIDYQCVDKPIAKVIQELNAHVPVKLNLASLAEIGLNGNEQITIKQAKSPVAVLAKLNASFDLWIRIGADAIEVTASDECEQEWVYDVTEFVTFHGRPVEEQWCNIDSLQRLITFMIAPDTWPVGNFDFPHQIENNRVFITVSQQPHIQLHILKLLKTMRVISNGKRQPLHGDALPPQAIVKLTSWPVIVASKDPDAYQVWIYDVSVLKGDPTPAKEAAWLEGLQKEVAEHDLGAESSTDVIRFSLGEQNVLCVNGTLDSQALIAKRLSVLVAQQAIQ